MTMYRAAASSPEEAIEQLEMTHNLGSAARVVNKLLRFVLTAISFPAAPVGCLLGFVHAAFMFVTLGLYALLWTVLWLPFLGIVLATSWLWSKGPVLWPVWTLLAVPFLIPGYVVAFLGPQDIGGEDKMYKLGLLMSWPYSIFLMFERDTAKIQSEESPGPEAMFWVQRGIEHGNAGAHGEAIADFSVALSREPDNAGLLNLRGLAFFHQGYYDEALEDLNRCIDLDPGNPRPYFNRGLVRSEMGDYGGALANFEYALTRETDADRIAELEERIDQLTRRLEPAE